MQSLVTYEFRAARAAGVLVFTPDHQVSDKDEAIPAALRVQFGTGPRYAREEDRGGHPYINGVTLVGGVVLDPIEWLTRDSTPWLRFHRPTGRYTSRAAPDATNAYMLAIFTTILITWTARPDRAQLARTVARTGAAHRAATLTKGPIARLEDEIAALADKLAAHRALVAELQILATEHAQLTATPEADHS